MPPLAVAIAARAQTMRLRASLAIGVAALALSSAGFAAFEIMHRPPGVESPAPVLGGPFELVDHTGKRVTEADYRGKAMLMFFGYTYCPDVCPMSLMNVAEALRLLGREAGRVAPLFVSVDPERDTPARLAEYVAAFDSRIVGLSGSPEQIARAARAYRVYYAKHERAGTGNYLVDHSAFLYVMDRTGRFVSYLRHTDTPETMAGAIRSALAR